MVALAVGIVEALPSSTQSLRVITPANLTPSTGSPVAGGMSPVVAEAMAYAASRTHAVLFAPTLLVKSPDGALGVLAAHVTTTANSYDVFLSLAPSGPLVNNPAQPLDHAAELERLGATTYPSVTAAAAVLQAAKASYVRSFDASRCPPATTTVYRTPKPGYFKGNGPTHWVYQDLWARRPPATMRITSWRLNPMVATRRSR